MKAVGRPATIIAVLGLAVPLLAGCQTPTERATQALLKACSDGDQHACAAVPLYQQQEALEIRRRRAIMRNVVEGAALGGEIGRNLSGGGSNVYIPPTPIYTPPPPPPSVQPAMHCTSMSLGRGMATTDCY